MGLDICLVVQRREGDRWVDVPVEDEHGEWSRRDKVAWWLLGGYTPHTLTDLWSDARPDDDLPDWFTPDPDEPLLPCRRGFPEGFEINGGAHRHGYRDEWFGNYHGDHVMGESGENWLTHAELLTTTPMQRNTLIGAWLDHLDKLQLGKPDDVRVVYGFV